MYGILRYICYGVVSYGMAWHGMVCIYECNVCSACKVCNVCDVWNVCKLFNACNESTECIKFNLTNVM